MTTRLTIDVRTLAKLLGVSHELLYEDIRKGRIRAVRLGSRRVVVPLSVAEELLGSTIPQEVLAK